MVKRRLRLFFEVLALFSHCFEGGFCCLSQPEASCSCLFAFLGIPLQTKLVEEIDLSDGRLSHPNVSSADNSVDASCFLDIGKLNLVMNPIQFVRALNASSDELTRLAFELSISVNKTHRRTVWQEVIVRREALRALDLCKTLIVSPASIEINLALMTNLARLLLCDVGLGERGRAVRFDTYDRVFSRLVDLDLSRNELGNSANVSLRDLGRLVYLDLSENAITDIRHISFAGLRRLSSLNLAFNQMSSVVFSSFDELESLEELDLHDNNIRLVADLALPAPCRLILKRLFIGNEISSPDKLHFQELPRLTFLSVKFSDRVKSLATVSVAGLPSLEYLYIDGNFKSLSGESTFVGLAALRRLFIGPIVSSLKSLVFRGLPELRYLGIEGKISALRNVVFDGLPRLVELDLSLNQFSDLSNQEWSSGNLSAHFEGLYLGHYIQSIKNVTFRGTSASRIRRLHLYENGISSVANCSFAGLANLNYLSLEHNNIGSLDRLNFTGLDNLQHLNLDLNQIQSFTKIPLESLPSLRQLYMRYNPVKNFRQIDIRLLNERSYLFLRKSIRLLKSARSQLRVYESTPVALDAEIEPNCSLIFFLFRQCPFLRYFDGDLFSFNEQYFYDNIMFSCMEEELYVEMNYGLNLN